MRNSERRSSPRLAGEPPCSKFSECARATRRLGLAPSSGTQTVLDPSGKSPPDWYQQDLERLFGFVEQPVAELQPDASHARRALLARSLFSAAHGLVALGLEEKLQFIPLPSLREQVTTIVTALGYGLAGGE